jgi:hypothetical protein
MSLWHLDPPALARTPQLGLERCEATFLENDVNAVILPGLTAEDFKEFGITSVDHRRQLSQAIARCRRQWGGTIFSAAEAAARSAIWDRAINRVGRSAHPRQ